MTDIYTAIYNLIANLVFGGIDNIVVGSAIESALTLISMCACCCLIALPFVALWKFMKLLIGR